MPWGCIRRAGAFGHGAGRGAISEAAKLLFGVGLPLSSLGAESGIGLLFRRPTALAAAPVQALKAKLGRLWLGGKKAQDALIVLWPIVGFGQTPAQAFGCFKGDEENGAAVNDADGGGPGKGSLGKEDEKVNGGSGDEQGNEYVEKRYDSGACAQIFLVRVSAALGAKLCHEEEAGKKNAGRGPCGELEGKQAYRAKNCIAQAGDRADENGQKAGEEGGDFWHGRIVASAALMSR